jgi:adhesin/invasin
VLDADDQPLPQVSVIASIASGGGSLSGTTSMASDAAGRASYSDLAILGTTGPRTLRFSVTDPALEVGSGTIQVTAGIASDIAGVPPLTYEGIVNSPVSPPPSVIVKDAAGNVVPGVAVTFTADRDASVSPLTVTTDQHGVAQVTSWTLGTTANVQYSLTAMVQSPTLPPVLFSATARAGAAGRLQIATQPSSSAQNGSPLAVQPIIQVTDQNGNPVPQSGVPITATVTSGSGTLDNASATTNGSGRAEFSGLRITGMVDNYTISFSSAGLAGVTSNVISLTAGPAAKLALASAAPAARSRVPLAPQPSIQVQDASGNPVAQAGIQVVASMTDGVLGGQTTATTGANGQATYTDLVVSGTPGSRTLNFTSTSPALAPVSVPISLPGVVAIAVQTPAPSSAVVGTQVTNVPVWILKDAGGLSVADIPVTVTASAGTVVPTSTTSDANGMVQVQSWTLPTAAGDQFVVVAVPGSELSDTAHVNALPDAAVRLQKIGLDSQSAPVNSDLDSLLVVRVTDQYGNGVGGVTVQWRACDGTGSYDPITDADGFSGAQQPTGPTAGTFCTRASSSGPGGSPLEGSPVEFTYFVTAAVTVPSQLRTNEGQVLRPREPAPVAPRRPAVERPSSR